MWRIQNVLNTDWNSKALSTHSKIDEENCKKVQIENLKKVPRMMFLITSSFNAS